jgi:hypothetical protein
MTLTGEVNLGFADGSVTCANVNGTGSELLSLFMAKSHAVVTDVGIAVIDFAPGQVGTGYSATVDVELADGRSFGSLGCTVDLGENVAVGTASNGTQYRVSGQGQCRTSAIASGASIDVSPFEFTTLAIR